MSATAALRAIAGQAERSEFGRDLLACLQRRPHAISPKYFYDAAGSRLFDDICALPEYYVTRTEVSIYERWAGEMAALIGPGAEVVEFGAGSLVKVRLLLDALEAPRRFVPIDLSGDHLAGAVATLRGDYPGLEVAPVVEDFTHIESLPVWRSGPGRRVGFFPGSTIGNFAPEEVHRFLSAAARLLRGGGLLVGVDLVKDPAVLHAAYNDAAGTTAAFNRNLLARANRELGSDFDLAGFRHYAYFNVPAQKIEMHLVCAEAQRISLLGRQFSLAGGESIHTEDSQKYTLAGFQTLASACGFRPAAVWCDPERLFSVHWLAAGA